MRKLMNPHTGSVDTIENWKSDYLLRYHEEYDISWEEWSADLIPVYESVEGGTKWCEI